jgi:hypothetical protein
MPAKERNVRTQDPEEVLEEEHCRIDSVVRGVLETYARAHSWEEGVITSVSQSAFLEFGWRCPDRAPLSVDAPTRSVRLRLGMASDGRVQLEYVDESRMGEAQEWHMGCADRQLAQRLANVTGLPVWMKDGSERILYPLEPMFPTDDGARTTAAASE